MWGKREDLGREPGKKDFVYLEPKTERVLVFPGTEKGGGKRCDHTMLIFGKPFGIQEKKYTGFSTVQGKQIGFGVGVTKGESFPLKKEESTSYGGKKGGQAHICGAGRLNLTQGEGKSLSCLCDFLARFSGEKREVFEACSRRRAPNLEKKKKGSLVFPRAL